MWCDHYKPDDDGRLDGEIEVHLVPGVALEVGLLLDDNVVGVMGDVGKERTGEMVQGWCA